MNLSPTLAQFFSAAGLMTLIKPADAVKRGTRRVLGDVAYQQAPDTANAHPVGTQVGYYRSTNSRDAARASNQGDPSRAASDLPGSELKTAVGIGGKENYDVTPAMLAALESNVPLTRTGALAELGRNMQNFYSRFTELRTQAVHSLFGNGSIWFDKDGYILQSATNATRTYNPGVPAANKLTLDGAGGTLATGDWSNTATDIGKFLRGLQQTNLLKTGYDLTTIYYGLNVPGYLAANATLKEYFKLSPLVNQAIAKENTIPNGFMGMNWVPVWKAARTAGDNVAAAQFGDKFLGVAPDISDDWYELIPCGTPVPNAGVSQGQIVAAPTAESATAGMHISFGYFNYGHILIDPYTLRVVAGDYFLPAMKVPETYYYGTCA